jgi:peptide/nickel transport system permease protein
MKGMDRMKKFLEGLMESLRIIHQNRRAFFGFVVLLIYLFTAIFGIYLVPLDMTAHYIDRFKLPSFHHLLGTDYQGRDTFDQLVHGSREVLVVAFLTALFATLIAVAVGITAGFLGGKIDAILMMIVNIFLTVPSFPVMIILAATIRIKDPVSFAGILSIWMWAGLARAIRSQILSLKEREFIEVAQVMGLPFSHIMISEFMPNIVPYIILNYINLVRGAILASVGVMFLGLVPLSVTNWGMMLNIAVTQTGAIYVPHALPYLLSPMFAIIFFQFAAICFSSGIEELFDPRLRSHA